MNRIAIVASLTALLATPFPAAAQTNAQLKLALQRLSARVAALENTATGSPTTTSVAGTYDMISAGIDIDTLTPNTSFNIAGTNDSGTLVLNANGTGSFSGTFNYRQITFYESNRDVRNSSDNGSVGVKETDVSSFTNSDPESSTFTWEVSGGQVVLHFPADGDDEAEDVPLLVADRLLFRLENDEGQSGLTIAVRR